MRIPSDVARKIGHYVYLYVDPRTRRPFYVGKGRGARALAHLGMTKRSRKATILRDLRRAHRSPQIDILAHGLPNEEMAFRIEAAVIDALGAGRLTNEVRGWGSVEFGRMPLRRLIAYYRLNRLVSSIPPSSCGSIDCTIPTCGRTRSTRRPAESGG